MSHTYFGDMSTKLISNDTKIPEQSTRERCQHLLVHKKECSTQEREDGDAYKSNQRVWQEQERKFHNHVNFEVIQLPQ